MTTYTLLVEGQPLDEETLAQLQTVEAEEHLQLADMLRLVFNIAVREDGSGWRVLDDALLFERKTLLDLTQSIKDGRLFRQGLRLASASARGVVILEGSSRDLAQSRMRREAIQGALVTLTLSFGIPLLRSVNPEETAALILLTARQGRAHATGSLPRPGHRPRGKPRVQSRVLQGLPGIGPERAKQLIDHFGSVEGVMAATALAGIRGKRKGGTLMCLQESRRRILSL